MSTAELRQHLKKQIDKLPLAHLRSTAAFIAKLQKPPKLSAADARKIAKTKKAIAQAERDIAAGRVTNWRDIRDDV